MLLDEQSCYQKTTFFKLSIQNKLEVKLSIFTVQYLYKRRLMYAAGFQNNMLVKSILQDLRMMM